MLNPNNSQNSAYKFDLMSKLYPIQKNILSYQVLSELNKFDANVAFSAFAIDIVNKPVCS